MSRADIIPHFHEIDRLIGEINTFVPAGGYPAVRFRADLAGMLVVSMAYTYENCIKQTIMDYAQRNNHAFGVFARNNFNKLNSKIRVNDLFHYTKLFDVSIYDRFKTGLGGRKKFLFDRYGINIEASYEQILDWRHEFAHAGIRSTTIEEAERVHRYAKRIVFIFDESFS